MGEVLSIVEGAAIELEVTFTNPAGQAVDPDIVELTIVEPAGTTVVKTRANGDLTNPEEGTWNYVHECLYPGWVKYDWYGKTNGTPISAEREVGEYEVLRRP